jgi:hypothetical protein
VDTRSDPRSRRPERYVSEVGTDTVPVNLVELQSLGGGGIRKNLGPAFLVALAAVATVAFALGSSMATPPAATPTAPGAAIASPTPITATSDPTANPTASPGRTVGPTPPPTAPPAAFAWTRGQLPTDGLEPYGVWGVAGQVLVTLGGFDMGVQRQVWEVARYSEGDGWGLAPVSPAVTWLYGGIVVDDRLWFLASVAGVADEDVTWELVSTVDGQAWASLGPTEGFEGLDGIDFLSRVGDTWVVGARRFGVCCDAGGQQRDLLWSRDGVQWTPGQLPALPGEIGSFRAALRGTSMVVVANFDTSPDAPAVLTSTDGRTWRRADVPAFALGDVPTGLACDSRRCVITTAQFCKCPPSLPKAIVWSKGEGWDGHEIPVPDSAAADDGLRAITATGAGFIAIAGDSGQAAVSANGIDWRILEVMPLALAKPVVAILIRGDTIFAVTESSNAGPNDVWQGSVAALGG